MNRSIQNIQALQNEYASYTDISFWVCEPNHIRMTERSLNVDFFGEENEEFLEFIDEYVKRISSEDKTNVVSLDGREVYVRRQSVYENGQIVAYCVAIQMKVFGSDSNAFSDKVLFFARILRVLYNLVEENLKLIDAMENLHKTDEYIQAENKRLQHEYAYDELTHVHSRAYFFSQLKAVDDDESKLPVSVVVGDVNNLKFTNDMFGHRHGDWLLYKIAQILQEEAAERFTVARCGGDEFYILMPNTKRAEANYYCHLVTERLKKENDTCLPASISLGAAKKSDMEQSLFRLLETADAKMYAAKSEFKSRQNQFDAIIDVLISRGFLNKDCEKKKSDMITDFTLYMNWDSEVARKCVYLIKYQDVGLTIIPEKVYGKSEYSEREWREIKKHPQLGMKLALIRPDTAAISNWMYLTHENYDGSGWPKGVSGETIPQEVMAVRLVTEYVEREFKVGESSALEFIKSQSGKIFEPNMLEEFIEFISE